jgi:hypothetical protein
MSTLSISPSETAQFLRKHGFVAPGKVERLLTGEPILVVLHGNARVLDTRSKHPYEPALARIEKPRSMMEHSDSLCYYLDFIEPHAYFAIPEDTKPRTILYLGGGNSGKLRTSHRVMLPYCFTGDARKMDELFPMNELYKSTRELQSPTPL